MSQPIQLSLGPCTGKHSFLLCDTIPPNFLGRDLLSKLTGLIGFAFNGDLTLKFPDPPEPGLICTSQSVPDTQEEDIPLNAPLLTEVPSGLWTTFNTDIARIKSAEPMKVQINPTKRLPKLPQCSLKPKAKQGLMPSGD